MDLLFRKGWRMPLLRTEHHVSRAQDPASRQVLSIQSHDKGVRSAAQDGSQVEAGGQFASVNPQLG